jgi:hypothetical protein
MQFFHDSLFSWDDRNHLTLLQMKQHSTLVWLRIFKRKSNLGKKLSPTHSQGMGLHTYHPSHHLLSDALERF